MWSTIFPCNNTRVEQKELAPSIKSLSNPCTFNVKNEAVLNVFAQPNSLAWGKISCNLYRIHVTYLAKIGFEAAVREWYSQEVTVHELSKELIIYDAIFMIFLTMEVAFL